MPPRFAALLCTVFIFYLLWSDLKKAHGFSKALWIPLIWMFLAGSRYVSQWMNLRSISETQDAYMEGSPLDRIVFILLIVAGLFVLRQRRVDWRQLVKQNAWVWLYFLFGGISILWSDFPFVSFKRWFKASGNLIMALVIVTERRPYEALVTVLMRLAFLLLPLSILFIKYYPYLGRAYHRGRVMFTGVAGQKNGLGQICLLTSIALCHKLILFPRMKGNLLDHYTTATVMTLTAMTTYLLLKASSATSTACIVIVISICIASRLRMIMQDPIRIYMLGIASVALFFVLDSIIDVTGLILDILGRDRNLTTRVPMWMGLLQMAGNPLYGVGFESFWLGNRLDILWQNYGQHIIQSHNGYLETYLNLGLLGLMIIVGTIVSGLLKVKSHLSVDLPNAVLRLSIIVAVAAYNWTEASFYGVSNMWLLLLWAVIEVPHIREKPPAHQAA